VQNIIQAAKNGEWFENDGIVTVGGIPLEEGEYELTLETSAERADSALALLPGGGFVLLDTQLTAELEAEGLARDIIRAVQDTRKAAGFDVSDRISLDILCVDEADAAALNSAIAVDIAAETLAEVFAVHSPASNSVLAENCDQLASEWVGSAITQSPEHVARYDAQAYANVGTFYIAVSRLERVTHV